MVEKDYKKLLVEDDVYCLAKAINAIKVKATRSRWTNARNECRYFDKFIVFGDNNPIANITVDAFNQYLSPQKTCESIGIGCNLTRDHIFSFDFSSGIKIDAKTAVLMSVDCENVDSFDEWILNAEKLFKWICKTKAMCVVSVIVPDYPDLPAGIGSLAEREFDAHIRNIEAPTISQQNILRIEALCRNAVKEYGVKLILLRTQNIIGYGKASVKNWDVDSIFRTIVEKNEITISDEDTSLSQSLTYVVDAALIPFYMLFNGMQGNIYNFVSLNATLSDIKMEVYKRFKNIFTLQVNCAPQRNVACRCLSTLKLEQSNFKQTFIANDVINRSFCGITGVSYVDGTNEKIYLGKLDRIKELEMEMLREVDRICTKHNLKYFLAAGTLLGAKRYGHNIPWDDDLDVAFLRKDFIKFRKIIEKELDSKFIYCSWLNEAKSHYTVDKIRIKDSWYSTKYSSSKNMPDGVFVDILVYDATSDIPILAKIHNKVAGIYQWLLLQVLWFDLRRRDFSNFGLYCLFRLICLVPLNIWHWGFEKWLMIFYFKHKPKYFIDGLGARAGIKLIPSEGLFNTVKIHFEDDFMAASPENPEEYLKFAYGENYLDEPPISEQKLHHNPARIDLGDYLFNVGDNKFLPSIDLRGELFE